MKIEVISLVEIKGMSLAVFESKASSVFCYLLHQLFASLSRFRNYSTIFEPTLITLWICAVELVSSYCNWLLILSVSKFIDYRFCRIPKLFSSNRSSKLKTVTFLFLDYFFLFCFLSLDIKHLRLFLCTDNFLIAW